jgi:hypothetical protein
MPAVLLSFLACNLENWQKPAFKARFGSAYEGLRSTKTALLQPAAYCFRRLTFAYVIVAHSDNFLAHYLSHATLSIAYLIIIGLLEPFEEAERNKNELVGETLVFSVLLFALCFTEGFEISAALNSQIGLVLIGVLSLYFLLTIIAICFKNVRQLITQGKRYFWIRKHAKLRDEALEEGKMAQMVMAKKFV